MGTKKPTRKAVKPPAKSTNGGARKGAGRKQKDRHMEDFANLERPPEDDALKVAAWAQRIVALELWRIVTGRSVPGLSGEIRATARVVGALTPLERLIEAEDVIKGQHAKKKAKAQELRGQIEDLDDGVGAAPLSGNAGGGSERR